MVLALHYPRWFSLKIHGGDGAVASLPALVFFQVVVRKFVNQILYPFLW